MGKFIINFRVQNHGMHKYLLASICAVLLFNTLSAQQQRKLVWSDEFNYKGLPDPKKWSYDTGGHGWGNNEAQIYTNKNHKIKEGIYLHFSHKKSRPKIKAGITPIISFR